jgi:FKBP-type peptidyl-prolyl cis-trans isomerase
MKINTKYFIFLFFLGMISVLSCKKEDKASAEKSALADYIQKNNITTAPTATGLYYIETLAGSGASPVVGRKVKVNYIGKFLDGTQFDASAAGTPLSFTFGVGQVIAGWDEGIGYMKKGGKARLIIPSSLAYGSSGYASIPGYSTLIFDVELVDVLY